MGNQPSRSKLLDGAGLEGGGGLGGGGGGGGVLLMNADGELAQPPEVDINPSDKVNKKRVTGAGKYHDS